MADSTRRLGSSAGGFNNQLFVDDPRKKSQVYAVSDTAAWYGDEDDVYPDSDFPENYQNPRDNSVVGLMDADGDASAYKEKVVESGDDAAGARTWGRFAPASAGGGGGGDVTKNGTVAVHQFGIWDNSVSLLGARTGLLTDADGDVFFPRSVTAGTTPTEIVEVDGDLSAFDDSNVWTAGQSNASVNLTDAATILWDLADANKFHVEIGANRIFGTPSNITKDGFYTLIVKQGAGGSRLMTWPDKVNWGTPGPPTLTIVEGKSDLIYFDVRNSAIIGVHMVSGLVLNDTDPPTPNPATFSVNPAAVDSESIIMTATTGSDLSPPVEYYFTNTSGGIGGSDSGWVTNPVYTDDGLEAGTAYCYTVKMRDALENTGTASGIECATTDAAGGWPDGSTPQEYDGVNDWNYATIRAGTDSDTTSGSVWVNPHDLSVAFAGIAGGGPMPLLSTNATAWCQLKKVGAAYQVQLISIYALGGSPVEQLSFNTTGTIFAENTNDWFHILWRIDLNSDVGNQVYVDDADKPLTKVTRAKVLTPNYTTGPAFAGCVANQGNKFEGCMSQIWLSNGDTTALDWDVTANRRKFIDAGGAPVDLGANGETPTTVSPAYFRGNGNLAVNDGNRGNITLSGSVVDCNGISI